MGCIKTNLRAARLKKKYSLVRNLPRNAYVAASDAGLENMLVRIEGTDSVSFSFTTPFPDVPSIVASFISTEPVGSVNVFIETASSSGATLRTSSVASGYISVHAMYIEGCEVQDYSFTPVITVSPLLGAAVSGSPPSITAPSVISNPSSTVLYTLYVNGSTVPGYISVDLASMSTYTYLIADIGNPTYIAVSVTNSKGTVSGVSNSVTIT